MSNDAAGSAGNSPTTLADDLLDGAEAIARFLGTDRSRVYYIAKRQYLPIGHIGGKLVASRSILGAAVSQKVRGA